jgi:hypothetical protein
MQYSFIGGISETTIAAPHAAASIETIGKPSDGKRLGRQKQSLQEYQIGSSEFLIEDSQKQRSLTRNSFARSSKGVRSP